MVIARWSAAAQARYGHGQGSEVIFLNLVVTEMRGG